SVVNGVMLRGFGFPNADRLVSAAFIDPSSATFFGVNQQISSMDFEELAPEQRSLDGITAYLNGSTVNVTVGAKPQRYTGAYVTENFLRALGVTPAIGRDFTAADNTPGAEKVALIGYGIWQRDFGGSSDICGRRVRINGKPATIIGVMPKGFAFPANEELWIPLYSEFPPLPRYQRVPAAAAQRSAGELAGGARRIEAGRLARPGERRVHYAGASLQRGLSGDQQAVQRRTRRAADQDLHAAPAARHAADDARVLRRRAVD